MPGLPPWDRPAEALWWMEGGLEPRRPGHPLHPLECADRSSRALPPTLEQRLEEVWVNWGAERKT
eukprot:8455771-Alexandrium_andersonii.AAC.1